MNRYFMLLHTAAAFVFTGVSQVTADSYFTFDGGLWSAPCVWNCKDDFFNANSPCTGNVSIPQLCNTPFRQPPGSDDSVSIFDPVDIEGNRTVNDMDLDGTLSGTGNLTIVQNLTIGGALSIIGSLSIMQDIYVSGSLSNTGSVSANVLGVHGGGIATSGTIGTQAITMIGGVLGGTGNATTSVLTLSQGNQFSGTRTVSADAVLLAPGGALTFPGPVTYSVAIGIEGGTLTLSAPFINDKEFAWLIGASPIAEGGSIVGPSSFRNDASFVFRATALFGAPPPSNVNVVFENKSVVKITEGKLTFNNGYVQTAGRTLLGEVPVSGSPFLPGEAILEVMPGAAPSVVGLDLQSGLLIGTGKIIGNLKNSGLVGPGFKPDNEDCVSAFDGMGNAKYDGLNFVGKNRFGKITIEGDYVQTASGIMEIELGAVGTDSIEITGAATLGGTLNIRCLSIPSQGPSEVTILSASGGISGWFKNVNGYFADKPYLEKVGNRVVLRRGRPVNWQFNDIRTVTTKLRFWLHDARKLRVYCMAILWLRRAAVLWAASGFRSESHWKNQCELSVAFCTSTDWN